MTLVKLCDIKLAPSPGNMKEFRISSFEILVINVGGEFYCTSARCTHAGGAPLSEGTLEGKVLTCPWHEAQFRVTDGQVLRGPAKDNLSIYSHIVKDAQIFVNI